MGEGKALATSRRMMMVQGSGRIRTKAVHTSVLSKDKRGKRAVALP